MGENFVKEGVVPSGPLDFLGHGDARRVGANDVGGEPSQDGEVLGAIVFSGSTCVLGEENIEHPVQPVLDTPMTAHGLQQSFGGHVAGEQKVADDRLLGASALGSATRRDASQGNNTGKAVGRRHAGVANDGGAAPLVAIVGGRLALLRLPPRAKRRSTASNSLP